MANLTLKFLDDGTPGDVRISFQYDGSWSVIGTDCQTLSIDQPTMNYGWLDRQTADDEVRRVVLHEFGHALGLIHEHQNPGGEIKWNRDQVIKDLSGPPNNWSLDVIESQHVRAILGRPDELHRRRPDLDHDVSHSGQVDARRLLRRAEHRPVANRQAVHRRAVSVRLSAPGERSMA